MTNAMDAASLNAFMMAEFPQVARDFRIERVAPMEADVRMLIGEGHLRPGGTVSGPSMFTLGDLAMYAVLLGMIGPVSLAVTTNANIDFLRKPEAGRDLIGAARLLKLGKTLAVGDVLIRNEGSDDVLARASMTYAIPPKR
ncbi:PaaI family thioesterase [Rhodobacter sp. NTK016B]|uniref:PaaI family thioesterase n=1 Tax=Rhodobacter sp. NTK016B TaxID=2759676 RepID=UPI001A8BF91B|nr:PaaI family thioesterase [Rhodobacter sp. NTK016B]MBN8293915.1 PaaI family thioesterase [Rhodobacter sp. NTK016B]